MITVRSRRKGIAMLLVLFFAVMAIPLLLMLARSIRQVQRASIANTRKKSNTGAANSSAEDFLRQFANSTYDDHYNQTWLNRAAMTVGTSVTQAQATPHPDLNTVSITAVGQFAGNQEAKQKLTATFLFESDLVRYGTADDAPTIGVNNVTYKGPFLSRGNMIINASNIKFDGGPLVVLGNLTVNSGKSATVNGNVFLRGKKQGSGSLTINGNMNKWAPQIVKQPLDLNYYENSQYTILRTTITAFIIFSTQVAPTARICYKAGTTDCKVMSNYKTSLPLNPKTILYAKGANFNVSGTVGCRVTVVAGGDPGSSTGGNIYVQDNLIYPVGDNAQSAYSVALLAKNQIFLQKDLPGDFLVHGVLFQERERLMPLNGYRNANFVFTGARAQLAGVESQSLDINGAPPFDIALGKGITWAVDPNLRKYPPPGLPETPYLLQWDLQPSN